MITFGQYNTLNALNATRQWVSFDQLCAQTQFQQMMVRYYIAVLQSSGLITAIEDETDDKVCYQLTEAGVSCLEEYERSNPELTVTRSINQITSTDTLDRRAFYESK